MISWSVGFEQGVDFSLGKSYKFFKRYISEELWKRLISVKWGITGRWVQKLCDGRLKSEKKSL